MAHVSVKDQLYADLDRSVTLRRRATDDEEFHRRRLLLRDWQGARLARTHADLVLDPRFSAAAMFFLGDLYGPTDIGAHIDDIRRVVPVMVKTLPASGLATVARAVELNALSEDLDGAMVEAIGEAADAIDNATYAAAYAQVGRRDDRRRQLDLIAECGAALDRLTHVRFIGAALKLMHKPAHLAGLGELQEFLERGYEAFGKMRGGAGEFISIVVTRERALSEALINGEADALPFERTR
jgi:hypothetical protein